MEKKIDGWEQNTEKLRIDFIFVPEGVQVKNINGFLTGSIAQSSVITMGLKSK